MKQTGANRFDRTAYFFQFDSSGVPLKMLKNKEVYHLKLRNQFEGEERQYACDLDGEFCCEVSHQRRTGRRSTTLCNQRDASSNLGTRADCPAKQVDELHLADSRASCGLQFWTSNDDRENLRS
jgi:hypothetical protein